MRTTPIPLTCFVVASAVWGLTSAAVAQSPQVTPDMVQTGSDIPAKWQKPQTGYDYEKRDVMIPMRDGVKLHTVIVVPKGAKARRSCWSARPTTPPTSTRDKPPCSPPCGRAARMGRRRLHPRLPGHSRQVRLGGRLRDDPPADRPAQHQQPTTPPTPTTPSTGW